MSINKSNLLYFFLFLLLNTIFCSCSSDNKNKDIVPNWHINSTLYLDYHSELGSVNNALYFSDIGGEPVGYMNHGIIVVKLNTGFAVYDATCTHDVEAEENVELDGVFAECPVCESKFNILDGGYPFEGSVARYPLKKYNARYSSSSNTLRIFN